MTLLPAAGHGHWELASWLLAVGWDVFFLLLLSRLWGIRSLLRLNLNRTYLYVLEMCLQRQWMVLEVMR